MNNTIRVMWKIQQECHCTREHANRVDLVSAQFKYTTVLLHVYVTVVV